jgi:GNAT superfamily N-acetyltransferase
MVTLPPGYEIGAARRDELSTLRAVETAAASLFPPEAVPPRFREDSHPLEFFEQALSQGRLWVVRALDSGAPVGFAAARVLDGCAHLQEVDVHPDHGRRGLGRALICHVADWARASGFDRLTLTTFRHFDWNAPFYARFGFEEIPPPEVGPELLASLEEEASEGFDPASRVAMRLALRGA